MTTMTADLAYTSDSALETAWARRGWDAVDRMVLWAVEQLGEDATFDAVAQILPAGVHYRVITMTLRGFVADGLVERRRVHADPSGPVTAIGSVRTVYVLVGAAVELRQAA